MGGGWGDGKREKERKAVRKGGVGVVGEEGLGALPKRYVPAPCNTVNAEGEGKEQKGGEGEVGARRGGASAPAWVLARAWPVCASHWGGVTT